MKAINKLIVKYHNRKVGTLALTKDRLCAFQYDSQWILDGFSLNPVSLPLTDKVFVPKAYPLEGLFGVFRDSLPDGWGHLLLDRLLIKKGIDPHKLGQLDKLAIIGRSGMGGFNL